MEQTKSQVQETEKTSSPDQSQKNISVHAVAKQMAKFGFGFGFDEALSQAMAAGTEKVDLPLKKAYFAPGNPNDQKEVDFNIHLSRGSHNNGAYFMNGYTIADKEKGKSQNFAVHNGITSKEAFNLLEGRSVLKDFKNKEGQNYQAWVTINPDSKDKYGNNLLDKRYDFDLKDKISMLPVKGEHIDKIVESLQKGNLQKMEWNTPGKEAETKYISAEPKYKNLNVYNNKMEKEFINWKAVQQTAAPAQETNQSSSISHGLKR